MAATALNILRRSGFPISGLLAVSTLHESRRDGASSTPSTLSAHFAKAVFNTALDLIGVRARKLRAHNNMPTSVYEKPNRGRPRRVVMGMDRHQQLPRTTPQRYE